MENFQKLSNKKVFMIGAGALGCEYLKQFALMGLSCGPEGLLTVTDDDTIEISNLNRQFLFRKEHVGESKSKTASKVAQEMNPDLKVVAHKNRVDPERENIFTDEFWDGLDMVVGAVDNVHARMYVDSKVVQHKLHSFESGTLGTKCNSQIMIPHKTQSYGDSQDPAEESIPLCTLRNYPYLIDHTIEWGRNYFHTFFGEGSADVLKFVLDPKGYIEQTVKESKQQAGSLKERLEIISKYMMVWPNPSVEKLVALARQLFQDVFTDQIRQLLHCFPIDYKDDKGNLFWSSPKRPPHVIEFDHKDEMHFLFIKSTVIIMSYIFNIK
jgi:ubiquitin-activating enzyme E1